MQILSGIHLKAFNVITSYYIFYSQGYLISSAQKVWLLLTRQKNVYRDVSSWSDFKLDVNFIKVAQNGPLGFGYSCKHNW